MGVLFFVTIVTIVTTHLSTTMWQVVASSEPRTLAQSSPGWDTANSCWFTYTARREAISDSLSWMREVTVENGNCDYRLVTPISDIVTIFPIPKANFCTAALLPCDYLLVYLLDIVTILPSS